VAINIKIKNNLDIFKMLFIIFYPMLISSISCKSHYNRSGILCDKEAKAGIKVTVEMVRFTTRHRFTEKISNEFILTEWQTQKWRGAARQKGQTLQV
jgi:hypothetical protein